MLKIIKSDSTTDPLGGGRAQGCLPASLLSGSAYHHLGEFTSSTGALPLIPAARFVAYTGAAMRSIYTRFRNRLLLLWSDAKGQDLIEYALLAGFVAVAAGAIMPNVA